MKAGKPGNKNFKNIDMKKILIISILSVALTACYKDYIKDYDVDGVYFS